jgi:hypothetical protein
MVKIGFRARIGFLVAVVVLGGMGFWFLWYSPALQENKDLKAQYATVKAEKETIEKDIARIPQLKEDINNEYKASKAIADNFFPVKLMKGQELDRYMQQYVDAARMHIWDEFKIEPQALSTLEYDVNVTQTLIYPLFEAADLNGDLAKELEEELYYANYLSARSKETVILCTMEMPFLSTKEALYAFIDSVRDINPTVKVSGIKMKDASFAENPEFQPPLKPDHAEGTVTISFYAIQVIEEPKV